jgi:hypothetical protein
VALLKGGGFLHLCTEDHLFYAAGLKLSLQVSCKNRKFFAAWGAPCEEQLSAKLFALFVNDHFMTETCRRSRSGHSRGSASANEYLLRCARFTRTGGHFMPGLRIAQAFDGLYHKEMIETALSARDAMNDFSLSIFGRLLRKVRICNQRPTHCHHVTGVVRNHFSCHCRIVNAMSGDDRDVDTFLDFSR